MNSFEIKYDGQLRTTAQHMDSGEVIYTDAPKDNHGLGETFSPTDLVCTSLASCMLTIMAISVRKYEIDIQGTKTIVKKTMSDENPITYQLSNYGICLPNGNNLHEDDIDYVCEVFSKILK